VAQPYWVLCLCDCILIGRAKLSSVGVYQLTLILSRILTLPTLLSGDFHEKAGLRAWVSVSRLSCLCTSTPRFVEPVPRGVFLDKNLRAQDDIGNNLRICK